MNHFDMDIFRTQQHPRSSRSIRTSTLKVSIKPRVGRGALATSDYPQWSDPWKFWNFVSPAYKPLLSATPHSIHGPSSSSDILWLSDVLEKWGESDAFLHLRVMRIINSAFQSCGPAGTFAEVWSLDCYGTCIMVMERNGQIACNCKVTNSTRPQSHAEA